MGDKTMKRIILYYIVFTVIILSAKCQPETEVFYGKQFLYPNDRSTLVIEDSQTIFRWDSGNEVEGVQETVEDSRLIQKGKFLVLQTSQMEYVVMHCRVKDIQYLTLLKSSGNGSFFDNWQIPYFYSMRQSFKVMPSLHGVTPSSASSFITETLQGSEVSYLPSQWELHDVPWAVSSSSEKKEVIFRCVPQKSYKKYAMVEELVIVNGFVLANRPHLYSDNARARTIRIECQGQSKIHVLQDTPNFQVVSLPVPVSPNASTDISIQVLDFYPGERYNDIVISGVFFSEEMTDSPKIE